MKPIVAVLHPPRVEPLPAAVLLRAAGAEDPRRAHPLPPEERLLPQEGRGEAQGRQGEQYQKFGSCNPVQPTMVVKHLGWVDLDFGCSTLLLGSR